MWVKRYKGKRGTNNKDGKLQTKDSKRKNGKAPFRWKRNQHESRMLSEFRIRKLSENGNERKQS